MNKALIRQSARLDPLTIEEKAADNIIGRLRAKGYTAYRVGGAVRDRLLGLPGHDVDVATDAAPAAVHSLFPAACTVGEAFAVVIVRTPEKVDIEVATFREDYDYADGRHPTEVRFSNPPADARRRDFSINALFYDPFEHTIIDFIGGLADLRCGLIKAIGNPRRRFKEDHLRILRAVRFAAAFDFKIESRTEAAIKDMGEKTSRISSERIFNELTRMLTGPAPGEAFSQLRRLGLLSFLLPEVEALSGVAQPPRFHPEGDVWQHTLLMLEKMVMADPVLAWSTLLHDIGKPPTHEYSNGRDRFPKHAAKGAELACQILRRLKASRALGQKVGEIIANHMNFMHVQKMRKATLRRLLARPTFAAELELHRLDCQASHAKLEGYCFILDQLTAFANQPQLPRPLLNGHDLLAMGLRPGPRIGQLLQWIQDQQLEGELTERQEALTAVRQKLASENGPRAG